MSPRKKSFESYHDIDSSDEYKPIINILKKSPKRFGKLLELSRMNRPTFSKRLKELEKMHRIVNQRGWYILIEHSTKHKVKKSIEKLKEKLLRNPTVEEIALDVSEVLRSFGLDFIMPAILDRKIMYIKKSVYGYRYGKSEVNLVVGNWKWITNMRKISYHLAKTYKKRWGIETGYREKNKFRIITTCRNHVFRFLLYSIAILVYNMWVIVNGLPNLFERIDIIEKITTRMFKIRFLGIP